MSFEFTFLGWVQTLRTPFLDVFMPLISRTCNKGEIWILLALALLCIPKTRRTGLCLAGESDIQAALGSGAIDCGFGLIGKFIQPIENGLNMVVTAGMHTGCTKILVKADSGINSIADLKGKTIGVSSWAGSEAVTAKRALYAAGIDK